MSEKATYVDIYHLPVPEENLDDYRAQAEAFGAVCMREGALRYREFTADDLGDGMTAEEGLVQISSMVEFESREHRDKVMEAVMTDPEIKAMSAGEQVADLSRMVYGGFETLVDA